MNFDPAPFLDAGGIGIALAVLIGIFLAGRSLLKNYLDSEVNRRNFDLARLTEYDSFMRQVVESSKHEAEARANAMQEMAAANIEVQAQIRQTMDGMCRSMEGLQKNLEGHEDRAQQRQKELLDALRRLS